MIDFKNVIVGVKYMTCDDKIVRVLGKARYGMVIIIDQSGKLYKCKASKLKEVIVY